MAALRRVEVERRSAPALRLENRSEQERAEAHPDLGFLRQRSDPHGGEIGIVRGLAPGLAPSKLCDLRRRAALVLQRGAEAMSNFTRRHPAKRVHERAKAGA